MNTTASPERTALVQRLHDALEALERGDESALRNEIDALAAARTRPLVQGLGRLARELSQALGELPQLPAEATEASGVELDEAEIGRFQELQAKADADEDIAAFVTAQDVLQNMANMVNSFVTKTLEKGRVPLPEEMSSGGSCGEGCGCHS